MSPIYRDTNLAASARHHDTVVNPIDRPYAPPGKCDQCGCHLSKYRGSGETRCAPCVAKREAQYRETSANPPPDRYDRARVMLAAGATFGEVARALGWNSAATACSNIRAFEKRHGLVHVGRRRETAA